MSCLGICLRSPQRQALAPALDAAGWPPKQPDRLGTPIGPEQRREGAGFEAGSWATQNAMLSLQHLK